MSGCHIRQRATNNYFVKDGSVVFRPPLQLSSENKEEVRAEFGEVISFDPKKCYGFIKPKSGLYNVYFQFRSVINHGEDDVQLVRGLIVQFTVDSQSPSGKRDRAQVVHINAKKESHRGPIVEIGETFYLVKGQSNEYVKVHREKLPKHCFPLKPGDVISYALPQLSQTQATATSATIVKFAKRTQSEVEKFFETVRRDLKTAIANQVLVEMLSCSLFWKSLGHFESNNKTTYLQSVMEFLQYLMKTFPSYADLLSNALGEILSSDLFQNPEIDENLVDINLLFDAYYVIVGHTLRTAPKLVPSLTPFTHYVIDKMSDENLQKKIFLKKVIDIISTRGQITNKTSLRKSGQSIPDSAQLLGDFFEADQSLPQVSVNKPYLTGEDYMETYYRLLRAEMYTSIQRGIQDYKNGTLDNRDMNCYFEVALAGFSASRGKFSLALHFQPARPIRNWFASKQLLNGSLVCISPNGKFDDVIWGTVSKRDEEILNRNSVIFIEVCTENNLSISDIYNKLEVCSGQTVMVESPTYFHALYPVLKALESIKIEEFPLYKSLVHCEPLELAAKPLPVAIQMKISLLDDSQKSAFFHCLQNQVAIVQGPPGTGKTFIGVKLVEALLSTERDLSRPILILTFKNHALDEFLKHLIEKKIVQGTDVVRIGGRSRDESLASCNLLEYLKTENFYKKEYFQKKEKIEGAQMMLEEVSRRLHRSTYLTFEDIVGHLKESQLYNLLNGRLPKRFKSKLPSTSNLHKFLLQKEYNTSAEKNFAEASMTVIRDWIPSRQKLLAIKSLNDRLRENPLLDEPVDTNELDEEDVRHLKSLRDECFDGVHRNDSMVIFETQGEILSKLSDFPQEMVVDFSICNRLDVSAFNESDKFRLLHAIVVRKRNPVVAEFEKCLAMLEKLYADMSAFDDARKAEILKKKKVVGLTISGAALNHSLLVKLGCKIVIVEEAAEVLEPSLLASLSCKTERLIMIGDHKQLRPNLDNFELRVKQNFDVSMMERMIRSEMPFKTLNKQNRMRPEFSKLLKDIYPNLEDNLSLVLRNSPAKFMEKSMFFWTHNHPEDQLLQNGLNSRTKTNRSESKMVVALAVFFLLQGYEAKNITILSAYLGQTKLLRQELREAKSRFSHIFRNTDQISVQTIDMYQGDENEIIIVSLVRSCGNSIGFLGLMNRRCVAQSRAKCGLYFVGNASTLVEQDFKGIKKKTVWHNLVSQMEADNCVGSTVPVRCPKHPFDSRHEFPDAASIYAHIKKPENFCSVPCGATMPCEIKAHNCKKTCSPLHDHNKCMVLVDDVFKNCNHSFKRKCWEEEKDYTCLVRVPFVYQSCGHSGTKKCYVDQSKLQCQKACSEKMSCDRHHCKNKCGYPHSHTGCQEMVKFTFPSCHHEGIKKCCDPVEKELCQKECLVTLSKCKHQMLKKCSEAVVDVICNNTCGRLYDCRLHECHQICGKPHSHDTCPTMVSYTFPGCQHPSPCKKKCSEAIKWKCRYQVYTVLPRCEHETRKECWMKPEEVVCQHRPCHKMRSCGHPCTNVCGESCDLGSCEACNIAAEHEREKFRLKAKLRIKSIISQLQNDSSSLNYRQHELSADGDCAAEFMDVCDKVLKFIQPMHNWYPKITKVEKVINLELERSFEEVKLVSFGTHIAQKFHGTGAEGVKKIPKTGFKLPGPPRQGQKPSMFGQGIYFATDSSKSAQENYTKGSSRLLLCDILLGKSKRVTSADPTLCEEKLRGEGFDSVYAVRDSKSSGGVLNDEFVIFDSRRAIVRYIIHYSKEDVLDRRNAMSLFNLAQTLKKKILKRTVKSSRKFDMDDPLETHYRTAEAHFMRMLNKRKNDHSQVAIESIDIVFNDALQKAFDAKKKEFEKEKCANEVLAFHGTSSTNVDSILSENLQMKYVKRCAHGPGLYFSEFPDTSMSYGDTIILFRVLPGREFTGGENTPTSFHSKKVGGNSEGFGEMLVISNPDQFLPYAIYNLKRNS